MQECHCEVFAVCWLVNGAPQYHPPPDRGSVLTDPTHIEIDAEVLEIWRLSCLRPLLGGYHNRHWLVMNPSRTELVLRRYKEDHFADLAYEFDVMRLLRDRGWPAPELVEQPIEHGGTTWCLLTKLPGAEITATPAEEQRRRGRLLAEFHETTSELCSLGQRQGWLLPDERVVDPSLLEAIRTYETVRPDEGYVLRWHLERAAERLAGLDLGKAEKLVLHSDFVSRNLLFLDDQLSGILDFEGTHLSVRVADFSLSWRGRYDEVVHGYEEVRRLSDLDWQLLVPAYWSWLFIGVRDRIERNDEAALRREDFAWQLKQLSRRSDLFGDLKEPFPGPPV